MNDDIFVQWDKPRHFRVKLYGPMNPNPSRTHQTHITIGVVATTVATAAIAAQMKYPLMRLESINDSGQVDIITDCMPTPLPSETAA